MASPSVSSNHSASFPVSQRSTLLIISLKTSFARFSSVKTLPIIWKGTALLSRITCYLSPFICCMEINSLKDGI